MKRGLYILLFLFNFLFSFSQYWTSPSFNEIQTEYYDDELWAYYDKNDIVVKQTAVITRDYGNYFRLTIFIANNSNNSILVDPLNVQATTITYEGNIKELKTLSASEYMSCVERRQNVVAGLNAFSQSLAASNAGYSTSTSTTYSSYNGYASAHAYGSAYGSGGYAYGSASAYGSYHGSSTSTTTTTTYDATAAQIAQYNVQQNIIAMNNAFYNERRTKRTLLLTKTTLYPGQYIMGYVYIKRRSSNKHLENDVIINAVKYHFSWTWE